jgi:AraC family transcriptional regulator, transcriptional activator of pobA
MKHVRPVLRDSAMGSSRPIWAERRAHDDRVIPPGAPVTHSHATLIFYTGGRSRVEQNGEWKLGEGDALLVPAGAPHRLLEVRRAEYWGLAFCAPCFAVDGAGSLLEPFERVRDGASAVVHVASARQAYLGELFRELEELGREPRVASDTQGAIQRSLLTLILAEVERAGRASGTRPAAGGGVAVRALRFIERNCLRRLTLEDVAAAVGRSPTYVTTALSQATGRSAGEWIVSGRMGEARRLLLHSDERVEAIAERVGYADATHFIRMFRREHGATPAAWRAARANGVVESGVRARRSLRAPS